MSMTDILDDTIGPSVQEVLVAEAPPQGRALAQMTTDDLTKLTALHFAPITAKRCEVERTQAKTLRLIKESAAMASRDFYYSFPVKKKGGGVDYIEGISIDGAMACVTAYGNAEVDCRHVDLGHSWVFLARFIDYERGVSVIRPFLQRKEGGSRIGGTDDGRRLEIAYNIGVSKATRNVIANAIRPYTNFCFEEAKNDLVQRVGLKLPENKQKVIARIEELGVDMKRVESQLGRATSEWTAREIAGLITQIKSVQQGLATPDMIWPGEAPPEPRRNDDAASGAASPAAAAPEKPTEGKAAEPQRPATVGADQPLDSTDRPEAEPPRNWKIADGVMGQEAFLKAMHDLLGMTESTVDLDALLDANADRLAKVTGQPAMQWRSAVMAQRTKLKGGANDSPPAR